MNIKRVTFEDDWEGIYINGKLWDQNHSIHLGLLIEELGGTNEEVSAELNDNHLPDNYNDIIREA